MYTNNFRFTNGGFPYNLHDDWISENDHYLKGLVILNTNTKKAYNLYATGKMTGLVWSVANRNPALNRASYNTPLVLGK